MKFKKIIVYIFLFYTLFFNFLFAIENRILFKVNNEIITSIDVLNEIEYLKLINKNLNNLDQERIFEVAKNSLIREKIKIIELSKYFETFDVEEKYYDFLMNELQKKLNLESTESFDLHIKNIGIDKVLVKQKMQIELLWNQLIVEKYSQDIKIDEQKIKDEILKNTFQKEFLISEIFFTLDKNQKLNDKFNIIKKDISSNDFSNAALIHSVSDSARSGGKLGWIKLNSLNPKIKNELLKITLGNFTDPIVIPGGFLILKIENEREVRAINDVDKELEIITNEVANKQLNQFSNIFFNKIQKEVRVSEY